MVSRVVTVCGISTVSFVFVSTTLLFLSLSTYEPTKHSTTGTTGTTTPSRLGNTPAVGVVFLRAGSSSASGATTGLCPGTCSDPNPVCCESEILSEYSCFESNATCCTLLPTFNSILACPRQAPVCCGWGDVVGCCSECCSKTPGWCNSQCAVADLPHAPTVIVVVCAALVVLIGLC